MNPEEAVAGSVHQNISLRRVRSVGGPEEGVEFVQLKTPAGMDVSLVASRCLDVYEARYRGVNLAFLSKNGITVPELPSTAESSFFTDWPGGLLTTCGLASFGDASIEEDAQPIHGVIASKRAEITQVTADWDRRALVVSGQSKETRLYRRDLELHRTVRCLFDRPVLQIEDRIHNASPRSDSIMVLYHVNFGYPLASLSSWFASNAEDSLQLDKSAPEKSTVLCTRGPTKAAAMLVNPESELGVAVTWDRSQLPYVFRWQYMVPGDWVVAIEPATAGTLKGRPAAQEQGMLREVDAGVDLHLGIQLEVLDGIEAIEDFASEHRIDISNVSPLLEA